MLYLDIQEETGLINSDYQGVWSGMSAKMALIEYKKLYALGTMSAAHFGIHLIPFELNDHRNELFTQQENIPLLSPEKYLIPWLATEVDVSILDAQTESMRAGHYQMNHIISNASHEIPITFIETKNGDILDSLQKIKKIMFPVGGDMALPKDYLMELVVYSFDRYMRGQILFEEKYLVALQGGSTSFSSTTVNGITMVQVNFVKMFPMLEDKVRGIRPK